MLYKRGFWWYNIKSVKNEFISDLLGIYGKLLTDYQLEIMELYYFEDLSLSEIAIDKDVSRNAIFTLIKRVEKLEEIVKNFPR